MPDIREMVQLLDKQNCLFDELHEISRNIQQSLIIEDVESVVKCVEERRTLLARAQKVQMRTAAMLQEYTETECMPQQVACLVSEGRKTLLNILEIDKTCEKLGERIAGELVGKPDRAPNS